MSINTTKITIADETRECLTRQMMMTYSVFTTVAQIAQTLCTIMAPAAF